MASSHPPHDLLGQAGVTTVADPQLRRLINIGRSMPDAVRVVFTLRKVYELSPEQIAAHLGVPEATVVRRLEEAVIIVARELAGSAADST